MSDNSLNIPAAGAAPESGNTAAPEPVIPGTQEEHEAPEPKTFTQEELDAIIAKEKAKLERKLKREQQAQEPARPANTDIPKREQFKTDEEYLDAVVDYRAEQKLAQREQHQRQVESKTKFQERVESAIDKYPDFETVVLGDNVPFTPAMADAIQESEIGLDVAYHLATNRAELDRIAKLSPASQAREIGKIEAALVANPPVAKVSSAPEPIKPVGSRATATAYDPTDPRSTKMSDADWIKARQKQIENRNRR